MAVTSCVLYEKLKDQIDLLEQFLSEANDQAECDETGP